MATILIIDDMTADAEFAAGPLRAAGHTVLTAVDGDTGIATARTLRPALVLLDVVMPVKDGFAVCKELKRDSATSAIPVVLLTSKTSDNDRFWGRRQGADDHIGKPYTPAQLMSVIGRFVS
jgi:twitching motility two-component system response regulator PilH